MAKIRIRIGRGAKLKPQLMRRLAAGRVDQVLVSQARHRIDTGGDSTVRYPELWSTKTGLGFRAGGQALRDTGVLYNALSGETNQTSVGVRLHLVDGTPDGRGVRQQAGFTTKGPNFIPLTLKARRIHVKGANPRKEGLKYGKDYIMAWKGVDVPARPIFNMPPENRKELAREVGRVLSNG